MPIVKLRNPGKLRCNYSINNRILTIEVRVGSIHSLVQRLGDDKLQLLMGVAQEGGDVSESSVDYARSLVHCARHLFVRHEHGHDPSPTRRASFYPFSNHLA